MTVDVKGETPHPLVPRLSKDERGDCLLLTARGGP